MKLSCHWRVALATPIVCVPNILLHGGSCIVHVDKYKKKVRIGVISTQIYTLFILDFYERALRIHRELIARTTWSRVGKRFWGTRAVSCGRTLNFLRHSCRVHDLDPRFLNEALYAVASPRNRPCWLICTMRQCAELYSRFAGWKALAAQSAQRRPGASSSP